MVLGRRAWFPLDINLGIQAEVWESFACLLANSKWGFTEEWLWLATLPYSSDWWRAAGGHPSGRFCFWISFRVTIEFMVLSLSKAHLPRSLRLDGQPALVRVLGFQTSSVYGWWSHFACWDLIATERFLFLLCLDIILSQRSKGNFMTWFVLWDTPSTMGLYIDRCLYVQSPRFELL